MAQGGQKCLFHKFKYLSQRAQNYAQYYIFLCAMSQMYKRVCACVRAFTRNSPSKPHEEKYKTHTHNCVNSLPSHSNFMVSQFGMYHVQFSIKFLRKNEIKLFFLRN